MNEPNDWPAVIPRPLSSCTTVPPIGFTTTWSCDWGRGSMPMTCCRILSSAWPGRGSEWQTSRTPGLCVRNGTQRGHPIVERQAREGKLKRTLSRESLFREKVDVRPDQIETVEWVAASLERLNDDLREIVS